MSRTTFPAVPVLLSIGGVVSLLASSCNPDTKAGGAADGSTDASGGVSSGGSGAASGSGSASGASTSGATSSGSTSGSSGMPDAGGDGPAGALQWYMTCGDAVCRVGTSEAGVADASAQDAAACPAIGSSCSAKGQTCGVRDPNVNCGAIQVCDDHDPTKTPFGCPISSRKFKDGITYVDDPGLRELHDETLRIRLATYNYKGQYADPQPTHLGFIIEDQPPRSSSVDWSHDRVDMYGYLSMVVAAMQVQEKEIAELRRELDASRKSACQTGGVGRGR